MLSIEHIPPAPLSPDGTEYMVRMRDGVRLATDVYLPQDAGTEPGPTVLIRLPYDKAGEYTFIPRIAAYITSRGYRVVAQDVRGKFRSEGETLLFVNEAYDGYDTIEWITHQSWSDGAVAMWGDSYYGYTQWAAVSTAHPALKAIAPRVTGTQLGERPTDVEGQVTRDVEMGVALMYPLTHFHSNDTYAWEPDWSARPYVRSVEQFLQHVGRRSISYDLWYPEPIVLRRFPNGSPFSQPSIPTLITIGWWDNCAPWSWADHREISSRPNWAVNEYLLIESIDHENYFLHDSHREEQRSSEALDHVIEDSVTPALDFFDVFVRGLGHPSDLPRVRWNLANTDELREATSWPPSGILPLRLHATDDMRLTEAAVAGEAIVRWTHDPDDLVRSSASNAFAFLLEKPDEAPLGERADVLVFTAAPVERAVDLVGPVVARARIWSSGPKMDFFVRLIDLAPDGTGLRIARGQVHVNSSARYRDVVVDLGQLGYRLPAGHRLRVHVSSSDFPEFVPQPGTGEDPWAATDTRPNTQSLVLGGGHGFTLDLSTLPGETVIDVAGFRPLGLPRL